jgi:TrmH family RNA methyltransferase
LELHLQANRLVIVLVEPQHSGNIGATVRAMANMGLHRLVVVAPPSFDPERIRWMAPNCDDVVRQIRIVQTVEQALEGCHRAVATTARHRRGGQPVWTPADFAREHWNDPHPDRVTALLFGREDSGLSKEDVDRCQAVLRIPTPEHASLNLGQAVLLVANQWFSTGVERGVTPLGRPLGGRRGQKPTHDLDDASRHEPLATVSELSDVVADLTHLLERVGYTRGTPREKVQQTSLTLLQGASLTRRQTTALRGMVNKTQSALDRAAVEPDATEPCAPESDDR